MLNCNSIFGSRRTAVILPHKRGPSLYYSLAAIPNQNSNGKMITTHLAVKPARTSILEVMGCGPQKRDQVIESADSRETIAKC
jgi:hypothetical protein